MSNCTQAESAVCARAIDNYARNCRSLAPELHNRALAQPEPEDRRARHQQGWIVLSSASDSGVFCSLHGGVHLQHLVYLRHLQQRQNPFVDASQQQPAVFILSGDKVIRQQPQAG
jgi:hypothetical protein